MPHRRARADAHPAGVVGAPHGGVLRGAFGRAEPAQVQGRWRLPGQSVDRSQCPPCCSPSTASSTSRGIRENNGRASGVGGELAPSRPMVTPYVQGQARPCAVAPRDAVGPHSASGGDCPAGTPAAPLSGRHAPPHATGRDPGRDTRRAHQSSSLCRAPDRSKARAAPVALREPCQRKPRQGGNGRSGLGTRAVGAVVVQGMPFRRSFALADSLWRTRGERVASASFAMPGTPACRAPAAHFAPHHPSAGRRPSGPVHPRRAPGCRLPTWTPAAVQATSTTRPTVRSCRRRTLRRTRR